MTMPDPHPSDDVLARAEDAIRQTPVPEGRPEDAVARILAAVDMMPALLAPSGPHRSSCRGVRWPGGRCGPLPPLFWS